MAVPFSLRENPERERRLSAGSPRRMQDCSPTKFHTCAGSMSDMSPVELRFLENSIDLERIFPRRLRHSTCWQKDEKTASSLSHPVKRFVRYFRTFCFSQRMRPSCVQSLTPHSSSSRACPYRDL